MLGGKRSNAGRKNLPDALKRKATTIYLTDDEYKSINESSSVGSFSNKCSKLLQLGLDFHINSSKKTIRFIDLFAGLGGLRIGFEEALKEKNILTECVFTSEIKSYAITVYKNYFGDENINGDITKIYAKDIPDFDFLLAGFPCQAFSTAGARKGFNDTRGTLFFDIERILKEKNPYGFILENVEGLVNHDNGRTFKIILDTLKNLNYKISYSVLNSQHFGMAQSRKRIYIVGLKNENIDLTSFKISSSVFGDIQERGLETLDTDFTRKLLSCFKVEELYGKAIKDKRGGKENIHSWTIGLKGKVSEEQTKLLELLLRERRKKKWAEEIGIKWMDGMPLTLAQIETFYSHKDLQKMLDDLVRKKYISYEHPKEVFNGKREYDVSKPKGYNIVTGKLSFEFAKILDPKSVVPTLVATDVIKLGVIDGNGIRNLTLREGLRLFGFPEDYSLDCVKYNDGLDLLGNTVCVPIIKKISSRIADIILEKENYSELRTVN